MATNLPDYRYFHLVPAAEWERQRDGVTYLPEAFAQDGFIHLTIGERNLIDVANLFYKQQPGAYVTLELDKDSIASPVRFDDDSGRYPHVYGQLNLNAVTAVRPVLRQPDGTFVAIDYT